MTWWDANYRAHCRMDYRRWVMIELAKRSGLSERLALYYTSLSGWDLVSERASPQVRVTPTAMTWDQFIALVGCAEWRELTIAQAQEIAGLVGLPTDGKSKRIRAIAFENNDTLNGVPLGRLPSGISGLEWKEM